MFIKKIKGKDLETLPLNKEEEAYVNAWHKIREYLRKTYEGRLYAPLEIKLRVGINYVISLTLEEDGSAHLTYANSVTEFHVDGWRGNVVNTNDPEETISEKYEYFPITIIVDEWEHFSDVICAKVKHKESVYNFEI